MLYYLDAYDLINRKIFIISTRKNRELKKKQKGKNSRPASGKKSTGKSSKSSRNSKKKSKSSKSSKKTNKKSTKSSNNKSSTKSSNKKNKKNKTGPLINISSNILCEVLIERINTFHQGLIIESLNSKFLHQLNTVLNCLLTASKSKCYCHFILLSYNFNDYRHDMQEKDRLDQILKEEAKQKRLNEIISMDAEDYSHLIAQDDLKLYHIYLDARKAQIKAQRNTTTSKLLRYIFIILY